MFIGYIIFINSNGITSFSLPLEKTAEKNLIRKPNLHIKFAVGLIHSTLP